MKEYNKPSIKLRRAMMAPYAIDIHTGQGDTGQLAPEGNFDENELPTKGASVWDE